MAQLSSLTARYHLSRFDQVVLLTLIGLALLTALFVWRGDRIGLQVVAVSPSPDATNVSARSPIQVTFDQTVVASGSLLPLTFSPPLTGTARWEEKTLTFWPARPLVAQTTYIVTLDDQLKSQQGRPLRGLQQWQFQTRRPSILYIAADDLAHDQLFVIDPVDKQIEQLTHEPFGISDYALAPDGNTIAFAALREDQGSDLGRINVDGTARSSLLACPEAICNQVVWQPDGRRFVYERRNFLVPGGAPGPPRLWWFNIADNNTVVIFEDTQEIGYGAGWSPDGQWLGYVSPSTQGIQLYHINDGRSLIIPSRMGGLPVWNPQGNDLLITDIQSTEAGFAVHLLRVFPETGQLEDISEGQSPIEDGAPVWSPDGAWIALTRKEAGAATGKQLWRMRADGSQAQALTSVPEIHHGLPAWSPDGQYLVYQRFVLKELGTSPSIWLVDLTTIEAQELVKAGNRPVWLP